MIKRGSHSYFFETPKLLEMSAVGIDVSDRFLRLISYKQAPWGLALDSFAKRAIPPGVFVNGEIVKKAELISILTQLRKEFGLEFVKVAVPEEKAYLFKLELPRTGVVDIAQAVEFKLEENVPLPASEVLFDYHVISDANAIGENIDVGVSVVPVSVIEKYIEVFVAAGMTPVSFQVETISVARAVVSNKDPRAYMVVHIHHHGTVISIVSRGIVQFTTTFPVGGKVITETLAKELTLSFAEAEQKKADLYSRENKENLELFSSIANAASAIKDEVDRAYAYWRAAIENKPEEGEIEKILLCGRDAAIAGFEKYFSLNYAIEVEVAHVWMNAFSIDDYVPPIDFLEALDFAVAAGIALP